MTRLGRFEQGMRGFAVLAAALLLPVAAARGATPEEAAGARVEAIRSEAAALRQSLAEGGERAAREGKALERRPLFDAHPELLSPPTLDFLRGYRASLTDSTEGARARILVDEVGRLLIESRVAPLDDKADHLRHNLTAEVEGVSRPLSLPELDDKILTDSDSLRVRMMMSARSGLWLTRLDPIDRERRATVDSLATAFGFGRYDSLSADIRRVDFAEHLRASFRFFRATDSMFRLVARELFFKPSDEAGGGETRRILSSDLDRAASRNEADRFLGTVGQAEFLAMLPALTGRSSLAAVTLEAPPAGGFRAWRASLRRTGEALQRGVTTETDPIVRDAGSRVVPMAAAALFEDLAMTPAWFEARRAAAPAGSPLAGVTATDLAHLVRWQLWCRLDEFRATLGAEQVFEMMFHGAPQRIWAPYIFIPLDSRDDEHAFYRQLIGFARGAGFTNDDGWNALEPRFDFGERADIARGYALAAIVEAGLRKKFGDDWFTKPEAGAALEADLLSRSPASDPDAIARLWGAQRCDFTPLQERYEELYDWSEKLLEGVK